MTLVLRRQLKAQLPPPARPPEWGPEPKGLMLIAGEAWCLKRFGEIPLKSICMFKDEEGMHRRWVKASKYTGRNARGETWHFSILDWVLVRA